MDVIYIVDLVLKDGDNIFFNRENCRRFNSLSASQVSSSWVDPLGMEF